MNRDRVVALVGGLKVPLDAHLKAEPHCADKVFEALNALAILAASVLAGTNQHPAAIAFYKMALQEALNDLAAGDRVTVPMTTKPTN